MNSVGIITKCEIMISIGIITKGEIMISIGIISVLKKKTIGFIS